MILLLERECAVRSRTKHFQVRSTWSSGYFASGMPHLRHPALTLGQHYFRLAGRQCGESSRCSVWSQKPTVKFKKALSAVALAVFLGMGTPSPVLAGLDELFHGGGLHEEQSRFLPGVYLFKKGNEYFKRGDSETAIHLWQQAAGWAMKDAQYNLGIAYFKGKGVAVDRPRGLAWLALAAERKGPLLSESLAAVWEQSTAAEHDRANTLWRDLGKRYADAATLPAAERRFDSELAHITGSRVGMPGDVRVWTIGEGVLDGATFKKQLREVAELNFGRIPRGSVDVGPVQSLDADGVRHSPDGAKP